MAQGYTGYSIFSNQVTIKDSPNLDAFSRLRISNPFPLFSSHFTYNLNPLLYETVLTDTGAVRNYVNHTVSERCATIGFTSASLNNDVAYMQTYEYFPYQPGKSQLVFITFNMVEAKAATQKYAGLYDGINGIQFILDGLTKKFNIYRGGSINETADQSNWNLDKLDGTGPSGYTLDITTTQILVIDFQALYVGRVRVGFDIGGTIIYCHQFLHANSFTVPYLQTATLPIRVGMTATASSTATTMKFVCGAVVSEGGTEDANLFSYSFAVSSGAVATSSTPINVLSIKPKTTFNSLTNRTKLSYLGMELVNSGSNTEHIFWELCVGHPVTGTPSYSDVNPTYSSTQYSVGGGAGGTVLGTPTTSSPYLPIVIDSGYILGSSGGKGDTSSIASFSRYPLTLNAAGTVTRDLGTLTLKVTAIAGTPTVRATLKFRELR